MERLANEIALQPHNLAKGESEVMSEFLDMYFRILGAFPSSAGIPQSAIEGRPRTGYRDALYHEYRIEIVRAPKQIADDALLVLEAKDA